MISTRSTTFGTGPVAQASISCGTPSTSARRKVVPIPRPAHATRAAKTLKASKTSKNTPQLILTIRRARTKVFARVDESKSKITLVFPRSTFVASYRCEHIPQPDAAL
ncbi:hypothetical protein EXIGLDRAFT_779672 [Exidia glandulosa HHB12029]|uniref:Uncharacterized protein n=1 Tax=Exidia glandulosa HHB12029 TaxID=1314781 RepID=A0A165BYM8_EXIGL|nr:hypothetical protein EXIGLDRAFT_779672 [Exidia glandulosa HHB12029]